MFIDGTDPREPVEKTDGNSLAHLPRDRAVAMKWWEAMLLISSLAGVIVGSYLLTNPAGSDPSRALLGFCLFFGGMGMGVLVEARRHRRIRPAGRQTHTT
jgi:hypothetical protein